MLKLFYGHFLSNPYRLHVKQMKTRARRWRRRWIVTFIIVGFFALIFSFMGMFTSDSEILDSFKEAGVEVSIERLAYGEDSIRYIVVNKERDDLPTIIFVHGAPGELTEYINLLIRPALRERARLVAVDRLGYGGSAYGIEYTSIGEQAKALGYLVEQFADGQPLILSGHSYGGPIAVQMGVNHPNLVTDVMLLAPALSPKHEVVFWIAEICRLPGLYHILPGAIRVSTAEKFTHVEELEEMAKSWSMLESSLVYIHGQQDILVPYATIDFAREQLTNVRSARYISLPSANHIIQFNEHDLIEAELLRIMDNK